ncbi:MAG: choice-of-anchor E domain-containing protein [Candidatus Krumholzibacteriia bacterium]
MNRLLMVLLAIVFAVSAQAATETQTIEVTNGGLTDFYATLDVPQHNVAVLGDLLSVTLEISSVVDGSFFYENMGASDGGFQVNDVSWVMTAEFESATVLSQGNTFTYPLTMVGPYDGVMDWDGTSGVTLPYGDTVNTSLSWLPADAGFAAFDGTGTRPLAVSTTVLSSLSAYGGQSAYGVRTEATWTATITYEYDPQSVSSENQTWSGVKALYR